MNEMQEAARRLHKLGFKTLPIRPGTKEPANTNGVKGATADDNVTDSWYAAHPDHGIGISGDGFVIFDFDVHEHVDGRDQLDGWDLPETLSQTTPSGGYHMIYRTDEVVRPSVNQELAVDVRGWHSYIVCEPTPGYCFEEYVEPAEANETVFEFLEHIRPTRKRDSRSPRPSSASGGDVVAEGGRNDFLFREGRSLRTNEKLSDDDIREKLHGINAMKCRPPLSHYEVDRIAESVCSVKPGLSDEAKSAKRRGRPRVFDHAGIAERLIGENGACFVDGMPAIRCGNVYEIGWNAVSREIIRLERNATKTNQKEVHHYLTIQAPQRFQSDAQLIAFKNGILDISGEKPTLREWREDDIIPNVIPHDWNPDAVCDTVDNTLFKLANGDDETYGSLLEVMGVCMYRSNEFTQSAILLGEGSNGKSTYIRMITNLLGRENISSLDLSMMGKQFLTGQLAGKLANLGDDISNEFQRGDILAIFKKVVDGNRIYADVKGSAGFEFEPYSTLVFSANEFPRLADYSDGMMRRLFPVEFTARFKKTDADYDPRIAQKLATEKACERMCVLGVLGLQRVIENHGFTPTAASRRRVEEIKADNDTVLAWALDNGWTSDTLDGCVCAVLYDSYKQWCLESGLQAVKRTKFTRGVNKHYSMRSVAAWKNGKTQKCFEEIISV